MIEFIHLNTYKVLKTSNKLEEYKSSSLNDIVMIDNKTYIIRAKQKLENKYKIFLK